jgi:glycerophosphoryl diester phosphodiesterase
MSSTNLPLLIAHRGGQFWTDRSFSYVSAALREGANIVELDIRQRSDGEYIVQHSPIERPQGHLRDALKRLGDCDLYLDIKHIRSDVNVLLAYVRLRFAGRIIVGTFDADVLRRIEDATVTKNLHVICPWRAVERAREVSAHWVTPLSLCVTEDVAQTLQTAGLGFTPSGNPVFKRREIMANQLQFAAWGAFAISTHHVRTMRELLSKTVQ